MELNLDLGQIKANDYYSKDFQKKIKEIHSLIYSEDKSKGTAWVDYPSNYDKKEMSKILKLAKGIKQSSDALLVIGIGGSYLGAKAGIDKRGVKSKILASPVLKRSHNLWFSSGRTPLTLSIGASSPA